MIDEASEVLLACLLWARGGEAAGLTAYEDAVLALLPAHGGEVIQRARSAGANGHPHEVQLLRFASQAGVDSYLADPQRLERADERDHVVARTEVFPVGLL